MPERAKMPEWVKVWGPVVVILGAMWTMTGRMEDRLVARIERLETAMSETGKAVARLEAKAERVEADVTWLRNNYTGDR